MVGISDLRRRLNLVRAAIDPRRFLNQPYNELATVDDVYYCYRLILGRTPDLAGWDVYCRMIGDLKVGLLAEMFLTAAEFKNSEMFARVVGNETALPRVADCDGFRLWTAPDDRAVSQELLTRGVYEPHVTAMLSELLAPGMTFVDIGANIGYFSILAAQKVGEGGKVISFEPGQRNGAMLAASVRLNNLDNVEIYPFAVSDVDETVVYTSLVGSNGIITRGVDLAALQPQDLAHRTLVRAVHLDGVLRDAARLDVVKIDIEGAEYRALSGAQALLARHRPWIVSEFSPMALSAVSGVSAEDYLQLLVGHGYSLSVIELNGHLVPCQQDASQVMAYVRLRGGDHIDILAAPT
jgi:FkbM family methyltransferase